MPWPIREQTRRFRMVTFFSRTPGYGVVLVLSFTSSLSVGKSLNLTWAWVFIPVKWRSQYLPTELLWEQTVLWKLQYTTEVSLKSFLSLVKMVVTKTKQLGSGHFSWDHLHSPTSFHWKVLSKWEFQRKGHPGKAVRGEGSWLVRRLSYGTWSSSLEL